MKFVSLHNHDSFSIGDGFNYPEEHYKFVVENAESDSMALATTNHGNINSLGYMLQAQNNLKKKGINFKMIVGNEMYIHPDLELWKKQKEEIQEEKKTKKDDDTESTIEIESDSKDKSKWYNPVNRRHHLVVLAQNQKGIENLFTLTSLSYKEGFYRYPRVDFKMLEKYNEGLIISTACLAGLPTYIALRDIEKGEEYVFQSLDNELKPLLDIFGKERAFLELQFNGIPQQKIINDILIKYSQRTGYKLISTADAHYARPEFWKEREVYKMMAQQTKGYDVSFADIPNSLDEMKYELYPKSGQQMFDSYKKYNPELDENIVRESLERTYHIAHDMIEPFKADGKFKLPVKVYENQTSEQKLKELCFIGLVSKNLDKNQTYVDRLNRELDIICKKGFADYFLVLNEAIKEVEKELFLGPGRGSAAGSLCSYVLGITKVDPIVNGLIFERFLSENRQEAPDSDQDIEDRDAALNILRRKFGEDNIVAITNYNTLQLKSLVKDVSKLHGIPFEEVNAVTSVMESEARPKILEEIGWDQKFYVFDYDGAIKHSPIFEKFIDRYPKVAESLKILFKNIKSVGKHAGGIAIVRDAEKNMPLIKIRGELQTPWSEGLTAKHLEQFGIIKYDFLGLATLKMIRNCIAHILEQKGEISSFENIKKFYDQNLSPDVVGDGDPEVIKDIYHNGKFLSIFQFTEKGVQNFAMAAKPKTISDISDITAIYRPGPLKSQSDKKYVEVVENPKSVDYYDHPIVEKVLKPRKGQIIYQEDFMFLAHELADFTLLEADELRKLLMKPVTSMSDDMKKKRIDAGERFIKGCIKNNLSEKDAHYLWEYRILPFISYGFVKSHAISYSYNSYACAWLFYHYPIEWVAAVCENESQGKPEDKQKAISLAKSFGYNIIMPDINKSSDRWQIVDNKTVVAPFNLIKSVGEAAVPFISENRPYEKIESLIFNEKIDFRKVNKRVLESLTLCGALDSLIDSRFDNKKHFHHVIIEDRPKTQKKLDSRIEESKGKFEEFSNDEIFLDKSTLLGFLDLDLLIPKDVQKTLEEKDIPSISDFDIDLGKFCWAYVSSFEKKLSKAGNEYIRLLLFGPNFDEHEIYLFGSDIADMKANKCALLEIAKNIGPNRWNVYNGKIRWIG